MRKLMLMVGDRKKVLFWIVLLILIILILAYRLQSTPAPPTPTATLRPTSGPITRLPTLTATPTPTATPEPTATVAPTATPEPTPTGMPTAAPTSTPTSTPTATSEPTATFEVVLHEVRPGEYLRRIALEYYGDEMLWPVIWRATNLIYQTSGNPDLIWPGDLLVVPVR